MWRFSGWFGDNNENYPHKGFRMLSPFQSRRLKIRFLRIVGSKEGDLTENQKKGD
jgi:hypothetical protein